MNRFFHFDLRTTDAGAAGEFYAAVLGHRRSTIWPLHEQALARGARPHWLGNVGVRDVDGTAEAFVARGATRLGPTRPMHGGGLSAVLRDPGGALVAVSTAPAAEADTRPDVVWHVLNTPGGARASASYAELLGWQLTESVDVAGHGAFQQFAWHAGGASVGAIGDIAGRPGVHPHWLFFFEVDALEPAMAAARDGGGLVTGPLVLPGGVRACVCDDPQGAAFALRERARR